MFQPNTNLIHDIIMKKWNVDNLFVLQFIITRQLMKRTFKGAFAENQERLLKLNFKDYRFESKKSENAMGKE